MKKFQVEEKKFSELTIEDYQKVLKKIYKNNKNGKKRNGENNKNVENLFEENLNLTGRFNELLINYEIQDNKINTIKNRTLFFKKYMNDLFEIDEKENKIDFDEEENDKDWEMKTKHYFDLLLFKKKKNKKQSSVCLIQ
jgi:hypothetical protein